MNRTLVRLTLGASLALLTSPPDASAGRGGGYRGGGGYGGGEYRGGGGYGGGYRGGEGGGGMSHSPSFSQPHPESGGSSSGSRYSNGGSTGSGGNSANHGQASSYANSDSGRSEASSANPNQSGVSNAGAAAAGAGAANQNQSSTHSNAGAAAAGAGYANNNKSSVSNAGAAAAGAGAANQNQSGNYPGAGTGAAGAGYGNRHQSGNYPNAGAAAAGAGYANRNQSGNYPNAGAAVAGAAVANNNGYNRNQPAVTAGYWNGNYGNYGKAGYGGLGMTSPSYGYGSTEYSNPYVGSAVAGGQAANPAQPANSSTYDYSQPVNPAAAPPEVAAATDPFTSPAAQAHQAFGTGDYAGAAQLTQQALAATPNDVNLHELYALELFAQGNYEQAAAPLYAVLSVGPGWNWTTLISNYTDTSLYTGQLRALEAFVRANPGSAKAQFVLAYHYISQGHGTAAIRPLEAVVAIRPGDQVSAQLLAKLQPPSPTAPVVTPNLDPNMMPGLWVAQTAPNGTINLSMNGDSTFTWTFASPGKPPMTISGPYSMEHDVLTLAGKDTPGGPLVGNVASTDANHLSFKKVGSPASDPGLQFVR